LDYRDAINSLRSRVDLYDSARARAEVREGMPALSASENPIRQVMAYSRGKRYLPAMFAMGRIAGAAIVWQPENGNKVEVIGAELCVEVFAEHWGYISSANAGGIHGDLYSYAVSCLEPSGDRFTYLSGVRERRVRLLQVKHRVANCYPELRRRGSEEIELAPSHGGRLYLGGVVFGDEWYRKNTPFAFLGLKL
jgi:hypothetical protein